MPVGASDDGTNAPVASHLTLLSGTSLALLALSELRKFRLTATATYLTSLEIVAMSDWYVAPRVPDLEKAKTFLRASS